MLTEKDYCDYDTCVALIDLGYPKHEILSYDFNLLLYQAQKFLREEKHIEVLVLSKGMVGAPYDVQVYTEDYSISDDKEYFTYEDALSEGLRNAVKTLKEK